MKIGVLKEKSYINAITTIVTTGTIVAISYTLPGIKESIKLFLKPTALIPFLEVPIYWIYIIVLALIINAFIPSNKDKRGK